MGRPITQEDVDFIQTLNIKNIMEIYKYTFIFLIYYLIYSNIISLPM